MRSGVRGQLQVAARDRRAARCRGMSQCMIRALASGMIGSSSPARIRTGGRSPGEPAAGSSTQPWRAADRSSRGPGRSRVVACSRSRATSGSVARCRRTDRRRSGPHSAGSRWRRGREHAQQDLRVARAPSARRDRSRPAPAAGPDPACRGRTAGRARRPRRCRGRRPAGSRAGRAGRPATARTRPGGRGYRGRRPADARHIEPDDRPAADRARRRTAGSSSMLAPMPLHSSSGAAGAGSRLVSRTETRMARPPTVRIRIRSADPARRRRPRTPRPGPGPRRSPPAAGPGGVSGHRRTFPARRRAASVRRRRAPAGRPSLRRSARRARLRSPATRTRGRSAARRSHSSGSAGHCPRRPGIRPSRCRAGLTIAAMCPLVDSTKRTGYRTAAGWTGSSSATGRCDR